MPNYSLNQVEMLFKRHQIGFVWYSSKKRMLYVDGFMVAVTLF
jgi:hypothetical protein